MRMTQRTSIFATAIAVFFVASCASSFGSEDEELSDKAVSLGYIAVAVDGYIRFGKPPKSLNGEALLTQATSQNPKLLAPLSDYFIQVRREGTHSSVLLCDKEKARGLAEDAGCTSSKLDAAYWKSAPNAPCEFQLILANTCNRK